MRIEDKISLNYDKLVNNKEKSSKNNKSDIAKKDDQVSISSQGKDILNLKSAVKNAPEIRSEQIDRIKSEIESGNYNITGKQVAEKIVNNAVDGLF
jgi:negative regulator of flagellin synthesis FlgM